MELPLHTDANYAIPVSVTDLAGNQAEVTAYTECLTVDTKPPEGLELTYPGGTSVNYLPSGWVFSGEPFTLQAAAGMRRPESGKSASSLLERTGRKRSERIRLLLSRGKEQSFPCLWRARILRGLCGRDL